MPENPRRRPRSAHFFPLLTFEVGEYEGRYLRRKKTYGFVTTQLMDLFSEQPKIERLVIYRWDGNTRVTLLFVKSIQLFEKVDLGS